MTKTSWPPLRGLAAASCSLLVCVNVSVTVDTMTRMTAARIASVFMSLARFPRRGVGVQCFLQSVLDKSENSEVAN